MQLVQALKFERIDDKTEASYDSSLVQFLIERATNNPVLGTYLHWYVMVECQDKKYGKMYAKVAFHFFGELLEAPNGYFRRDELRRQGQLIEELSKVSKHIRAMKEGRIKKVSIN